MIRAPLAKLAALTTTLFLTYPAFGQDAEPAAEPAAPRVANGQAFGAWQVTCEAVAVGETACVLTQRLLRSEDGAFLAELLAFSAAEEGKTYLAARVPNGVYLPSGFAFKAEDDDARYDFTWQSCNRDLCEALLEVDAAKLAELAEIEAGVIAGYRPALASEPLVFRLALTGAPEGLAALAGTTE